MYMLLDYSEAMKGSQHTKQLLTLSAKDPTKGISEAMATNSLYVLHSTRHGGIHSSL